MLFYTYRIWLVITVSPWHPYSLNMGIKDEKVYSTYIYRPIHLHRLI